MKARKVLSALMSVVLVMGLCPALAYAADSTSNLTAQTLDVQSDDASEVATEAAQAYAIVYSDGEMVFQRGNKADSKKTKAGKKVVAKFKVSESKGYAKNSEVPWYNEIQDSDGDTVYARKMVKTITIKDKLSPVSTAYWFNSMFKVTQFNNISRLDTSKVKDMRYMFANSSSISTLDLSSFNTSRVTDMRCMFVQDFSLKKLNVKGFNTSKVEDMNAMFRYCVSLKSLDLSSFDTKNAQKPGAMSYMFTMDTKTSSVNKLSSITFGSKFHFYNDGTMKLTTVPNGGEDAYSGKWTLKDGSKTYTAKKLGNLGSKKSVKGTWVWEKVPTVSYRTHVQNVGWQSYVKNGDSAGTSGRGLRLEGMNVKLIGVKYTGSIQYCTHIQNVGWQAWKKDNQMSGTSGRGLRLEAMKVKLTGEMAKNFDIYYRVHAQNKGWMGWAKNGASAGTAGYGYRLEAMQIKLVPKGGAAPGSTKNAFDKK